MTNPSPKINLNLAFKELEDIIKEFESNQIDLETSLPKFKRGMDLAKQIKDRLKVLEVQIEEIKDQYPDLKAD